MTESPGLILYGHPFSSYCQKAIVALHENAIPFTLAMLDPDHPENDAAWGRHWPFRKMPLLDDGGTIVPEATIIIEHLQLTRPGPARLIPDDPTAALEVRKLDRIFDNYLAAYISLVSDALRPEDARDPYGAAKTREGLDVAYRWADAHMAGRTWACGDAFTLADCAAAPHLLYADWAHPIPRELGNLHAYRARLIARPSFARAIEAARPWRPLFPLGAPTDRD